MQGAKPDKLAVELAELERIPLAYVKSGDIEELQAALRDLCVRLMEVEARG